MGSSEQRQAGRRNIVRWFYADETPIEAVDWDTLATLLCDFEERDQYIVRMKCGYYQTKEQLRYAACKLGRDVQHGEVITFEEISIIYGVSRERVRQLFVEACFKLKVLVRSNDGLLIMDSSSHW